MRDHNSFSALTKIKLLDRYKFLYTWDGRAIDFAFLYSLTAKSYSPLLMLPRIVLGKLNNVRNLCSIPWTDLIFSAWSYSRAIQNRERQREKCNKCDQCCIRCYIFPIQSKFEFYKPVSQIEAEKHDWPANLLLECN